METVGVHNYLMKEDGGALMGTWGNTIRTKRNSKRNKVSNEGPNTGILPHHSVNFVVAPLSNPFWAPAPPLDSGPQMVESPRGGHIWSIKSITPMCPGTSKWNRMSYKISSEMSCDPYDFLAL